MAPVLSWAKTFLFICVHFTLSIGNGDARNTLCPGHVLEKGQTLISANGIFELGFFNHSSKSKRHIYYIGIWYKDIKPLTVVWVGNRRRPLRGTRINLDLDYVGNLFLRDDSKNYIFLFRQGNKTVVRPMLMLLDSGNLVILRDGNNRSDNNYLWQSFDFPTDTLLPGMKLGWDLKPAKKNRFLTSWRMSEDPSLGDFIFGIDSPESSQLLLEKNSVTQSRWGPWDGERFSGTSFMDDNIYFRIVYHSSPEEVYVMFELLDPSILLRLELNSAGSVRFLKWKRSSGDWIPILTLNQDICDMYMPCGPYGVCYPDDRGCQCLSGFVSNSPHDWQTFDTTDGCRRKYPLSHGDGFMTYEDLKLPDNFTVWKGLSPMECKDHCSKDCTCMAYTNINVHGNGVECVMWLNQLVDIRYSTRGGNELNIRMAVAEIDDANIDHETEKDATLVGGLVLSVLWALAFWGLTYCLMCLIRKTKKGDGLKKVNSMEVQDNDMDIQLFEKSVISAATNNFCAANKIGEGGFGPVYRGELSDGRKIAVKRLSEHSHQGYREFRNETKLIAQLQHRNLVKLLGCCIDGEERMLIYEYLPNRSLNEFIFDPARKSLLPWQKRFHIIKGIAKGLEYLHFGSRLRVIHRDLKASNILLDDEMNPKISDFGLARNSNNEIHETTRRVIGTYGYMSPEYMLDGHYSSRSDVFSFGVLILEIISGERNWGFHHPDHEFNLLGHAWKLWVDGRELELKDPAFEGSSAEAEVKRCIQIGLLCVQQCADERPTMAQVVSMLECESVSLSQPQEPGFFTIRSVGGTGCSTMKWNYNSNGLTITMLTGRA